ncbi:MAG TPA: protein translocase subunit SecF [Clostridiales bacterium]|nr:protein translocase subunit SecF [Clostridiales bacterium]
MPQGRRKARRAGRRAPAGPAEEPRGTVRTARRVFGLVRVGSIDFIGRRKWFAALSTVLILVSLVSLGVRGLNLGIDFTGGNSYRLEFGRPVADADLRAALGRAGVAKVSITIDRDDPTHVVLRTPYLDEDLEKSVLEALRAEFGDFEAAPGDLVTPTIGAELLRDALIATALGCLGIFLYVALRFEYRLAAAGIAALLHDTVITVGAFSVLGLEVNAPFLAAVLMVMGYSINDTIVVFDRVRENLKHRGRETLAEMANRSLNETFVRSVNTSVTALAAIAAVYFFGGVTTRDFALALMVGIIVGTYSSVCMATPVWLWWRSRDERSRRMSKMVDGRRKVRV